MAAHDEPMGYPGPNNPSRQPDADLHLERLLAADVEEPFYRSLFRNVKEFIHPPKLPPLEVTSKPVPVKEIWGFYGGQEKRAGLSSLAIHVGVLALLFLIGTNKAVQKVVKEQIDLIAPDLRALQADGEERSDGRRRRRRRSFSHASEQRQAAATGRQAVCASHGGGSQSRSEAGDGAHADHSAGRQYSESEHGCAGRSAGEVRHRFERPWFGRRNRYWPWRRRRFGFRAPATARVMAATWVAALTGSVAAFPRPA